MLVEIQCDKFMTHNKQRKPIRFHPGLNVVIGDDNGSNSIGKSTFLMILDFVFGGTDYVKKCTDVQENVKEHTINFTFEFDDHLYHFARNTIHYQDIIRCDSNYVPLLNEKPMTVQSYGEFLSDKYGLTAPGLKWRGAISRFIRVYKRDTLDVEHPLQTHKNEKAADSIKSYMRLLNRYAVVEKQINQAADAKDEKEAFRKTTLKYNHIPAAKNERQKAENESRIAELEEQEKKLDTNNSQGLLDLDSMTAYKISFLKERLVKFRRQQALVQSQLTDVRRDMTGKRRSFKRTFTELEHFFPNENFHALEEIEKFHQQLSKILSEEYAETEKDLVTTDNLLTIEIKGLEKEITDIKEIPNVSDAILKEFAKISTEINNLREANKNFDELNRLSKIADDYAKTRDAVTRDQLLSIEFELNHEMSKISLRILNDSSHLPPVIHLERMDKYTFHTPNDGGTGAETRGLITFDLANLNISSIPFLVHDSLLLKNIEKPVFSRIIDVYDQQKENGKQVFMAYDTLDSYSPATRQLIEKNAVLKLSPGGNELFGWAWNKEKQDDETKQK